jgi:unsaturated chondroitin disaccharide hydrolase
MMNLPLLYWAYEESGNPSFLHIAMNHADTAAKVFIRPDGSSRHIVEFDPVTGDWNGSYGGQGMSYGSSWTRGQGWALYGFTLSYMHTKKERYLETAERVADYFISCIPESGLIPVDFYQDPSCDWRDDTAGAIAACGLIELSKVTKNWKKQKYMDAAIRLLKAIDEKGCNYDPNVDELLEKCTAAYNETDHNFPMIYADYYFIEAIWKLTGDELFIW